MKPSNLKKLRNELGVTQGYCANKMHLHLRTIQRIEDGECKNQSTLNYYELFLKNEKSIKDYRLNHR